MNTGYENVIFGCALFVIIVMVIATAVVLQQRKHMRQLMEQMDHMLDVAMKGEFRETCFDESMLSSMETRLAHYLTASEVSAEHVKEEKEKIKELLGDISHQTKTPIANLMLYSQLLEEQIQRHKDQISVEEYQTMTASTEAIQKQSQRLKFLIESLVKTSRLENGVLAFRPEEHQVEELLHNAVEQVRPKAEARGLTVEIEQKDEPTGTMIFDLKWTVEALYNLLDNAVKYACEGTGIQVKAYSYSMFYQIDVINKGIPISDSEQEKVFQRFYRGAAVSELEGVGIGLYLTRQIVSSQGGYLKVSTGKEGVTIFSMYLPIR